MGGIQLNKDDVTVQPIVDLCMECGDMRATCTVEIDFRSAGMAHSLGRYCSACAGAVAARIRDGLPAPRAGR